MMKTILSLLLLLQFQSVLGQKDLEQIISETPLSTNYYSPFSCYDSAKEKQGVSIQHETQILKRLNLELSAHSEYYLTGKYEINELIVLFISKYGSYEDIHFAILLDTSMNVIDRLDETAYYNDEGFYGVNAWIRYNILTRNIHNSYNNPEYLTKQYSITNSGFEPVKNQVIIKTPSGVRIRTKPSINSPIVATAPNSAVFDYVSIDSGDDIAVLDNGKKLNNPWLKIAPKDSLQQLGYVFGAFAKRHIEVMTNEYRIMLDEISKEDFDRGEVMKKSKPPIEKISDVKNIKGILKNQLVGEFKKDGYYTLKKIVTDNDKEISNLDLEECMVSAYYPNYHYLLLECGHSSDHIVNLRTGEDDINRIGNPDYYVPSPQNTFRLNGYYSGQANVHFLEKNNKDKAPEYLFEMSSLIGVDFLEAYFWIDDTTLLIKVEQEHYKIQLHKL